jgi:hypothetical protein
MINKTKGTKEQMMGLPTDDKARKDLPIFRGPLMYFPDALLALAAVCQRGNDQHNPGEALHWAREKSTEQMDTALRHMMDHGLGTLRDTDGMWHLAKAAWRLLAELQLTIEKEAIPQQIDDHPIDRAARTLTAYPAGNEGCRYCKGLGHMCPTCKKVYDAFTGVP